MVDSQQPAVTDCPAENTAEYIATPFIARKDAITDHHRNSPDMVSNDFHGHFLIRLGIITTTDCNDFFDNREYQIGFKIRFFLLDDGSQPFQSTACINIFLGQRFIFPIFCTIILGKDKIPNFQIPVAVTAYSTSRFATAPFRTKVIENFTVRTTGTFTDFPEIIVKFENAFISQTNHIMPIVIRFFIVRINSYIQLIRVQFDNLREKFPGPGNSFFLEVVAKGKVAEHFKKRMMAGSAAYIIYIICTDTFLTRRNPVRRRYEFTCKIRF